MSITGWRSKPALIVMTIDNILRGSIKLGLPLLRLERELARRNNEVTKSRIYDLHGDFVASFPAEGSGNFFTGAYDITTGKFRRGVYEEFSVRECGSRRSKAYNVGYSRCMTEKHFRKLKRLFSMKKASLSWLFYCNDLSKVHSLKCKRVREFQNSLFKTL